MRSKSALIVALLALFVVVVALPQPAFAFTETIAEGIPEGWVTGDVTFTLPNPEASGDPLLEIFYFIHGNNGDTIASSSQGYDGAEPYCNPITVSAEGLNTVYYYSWYPF